MVSKHHPSKNFTICCPKSLVCIVGSYGKFLNRRIYLLILLGLLVIVFIFFGLIGRKPLQISTPSPLATLSPIRERNRILCYILISETKTLAARTISQTWGKHCDQLVFFRDNNNLNPIESIGPSERGNKLVYLNTTEGYPYLWSKTKAAILYLSKEPFTTAYDWFLKADHDTFVIVENLRKFVRNLEPEKALWFGYKIRDSNMEMGYMSGGAGYVFSRAALTKLGTLFRSEMDSSGCDLKGTKGYEDLELGKCCIEAGIEEVSSTDSDGSERFLPLPLPTLLNGDLSKFHWLWKQAWNPLKIGPKCCSQNLISIHQLSPKDMKTLYFLIYKLKINVKETLL